MTEPFRPSFPRPDRDRVGVILAAVLLSLFPHPLSGQLLTRAEVQGGVESGGLPVGEALVSLIPVGAGLPREVFSDRQGRFAFPSLPPGRYDLRVEAVGHRPSLVQGMELVPSRTVRLQVVLTPEAPPVTRVDTLSWSGSGWNSLPGAMEWIGGTSADPLPDRSRDTGGLSRRAAGWSSGGGEGLPSGWTGVALDGVRLRPALGSGPVGEAGTHPLVPREGLEGAALLGAGEDPEWGGGTGGILALFAATGGPPGEVALHASGSGGPLWSSGRFPGTPPSAVSFLGGGRAAFPLAEERGGGIVALSFERSETPRTPALDPEGMAALEARPDLPPGTLGLALPGVGERTALAGLSRLDWSWEDGRSLGITALFGRSEYALDPEGTSWMAPGGGRPGVRADLAAAASYQLPLVERFRLETRVGVHRSRRAGPGEPGAAGLLLVGEGGALGGDPALPVSADRTTALLTSVVHWAEGNQTLKLGAEGRLSSHRREGLPGTRGVFVAPDLAGLAAGRGSSAVVTSLPGAVDFGVTAIAAFGRVGWRPAPGVELGLSARYDLDRLPGDLARPDTLWARLSGLVALPPTAASGVGGGASVVWDVGARGETVLRGGVSVSHDEFDPVALAELAMLDGRPRVRRGFGAAPGWPSPPSGGGSEGALLALAGPDLGLPRTLRGSGGVSRRVGPGTVLHLGGVFRRTEGLVRADDLNRVPGPRATDAGGRPLFGEGAKEGGLLGVVPGSNRRFAAYDHVLALTPAGWSEYRAFEVGVEGSGARFGVRASYRFSRTQDNLPGLAGGDRLDALDPFPGREADWREGTSDLDIPHRAVVEFSLQGGPVEVAAIWTLRSGVPFTPGFRPGVDVNGDGSFRNDPAVLPGAPDAAALLQRWGCGGADGGGAVVRNGCRGPAVQGLDLRLSLGSLPVGSSRLAVTLEGLDLLEPDDGFRDTALFLVDPSAPLPVPVAGVQALPLRVNPRFGEVIRPATPGRLIRIGFRLAPGRAP